MILRPKRNKVYVNYTVPKEIKAKIKRISEVEGIPMGHIIAQLVERQWNEGGYDEAVEGRYRDEAGEG